MNRCLVDLNRCGRISLLRGVYRPYSLTNASRSVAETRDQTRDATRDEPIQFTSSGASDWKARQTFQNKRNRPKFEPHIISLSFTAMLVYFCVFREENDIDEALGRGLFDHLPQMEEQQLRITLEYQKMHGQDTSAVEERLMKVRKQMTEIDERRKAEGTLSELEKLQAAKANR